MSNSGWLGSLSRLVSSLSLFCFAHTVRSICWLFALFARRISHPTVIYFHFLLFYCQSNLLSRTSSSSIIHTEPTRSCIIFRVLPLSLFPCLSERLTVCPLLTRRCLLSHGKVSTKRTDGCANRAEEEEKGRGWVIRWCLRRSGGKCAIDM